MGVYERSLVQRFKTARSKAPCVLVFDCIEDVVPRGSSGKSWRHVAAMKRELDGLRDARVFVLALSASCERIASRGAARDAGRSDAAVPTPPPAMPHHAVNGESPVPEIVASLRSRFGNEG